MIFPLALATHLYTATYAKPGTSCNGAQVERFTFIKNRLTKQPDLRLTGMEAPIATDSKGNLYTQFCKDLPFGYGYIYVFPLGSTKPSRIIRLPSGGSSTGVFADAMAVDAAGDLFVAFENSYERTIAVYPPGATKPSSIFSGYTRALAVDRYGALYASAGSGNVDVWAHPAVYPPHYAHTLSAWADALLVDSIDLYTCCTASSIVVYSNWVPVRVITPKGNTASSGLAIAPSTFLYTIYNGSEIVGFPKWTSGAPKVLDSVQLDYPAGALTIGL